MEASFSWIVVSLFLALAASVAAAEASPLVESCDGCHGQDGISRRDEIPTIAGISEFVHSEALFLYQERERPCRESEFRNGSSDLPPTDMCAIAAGLSENQINELAAYYAAKPFIAAAQTVDPDLVDRGRAIHEQQCERCHTDSGTNPEDDASLLKGQWMAYLRQAFTEYRAGEREQPKIMQVWLDALSESELEALAHFYGSPE